jgi:hypothetical protein
VQVIAAWQSWPCLSRHLGVEPELSPEPCVASQTLGELSAGSLPGAFLAVNGRGADLKIGRRFRNIAAT